MNPHYQQQLYLRPSFIPLFNFSHKRPTLAFSGENGYTLSSAQGIAHSGSHGETRAFRLGVLSLPSERFARFGNPAWPGVRTANFAAFRPWSGALPENAESLRNSDALMCVAVPRRRGPAGLRDFFAFVEVAACTPYSRNFFQFSRRSSLCCSCANLISARSFSARSCSRVFGFVIVIVLLF